MKAITTKRFFGDESGAVAATYALAMIPLIAFAGVAFDYARVMGLDSELQNGADQAALAAASQLDGRDDACERAANAASGMLQNLAILSSESKLVTVASETGCDTTGRVRFYQDKEKTTAATEGGNANYVEVQVDGRRLNYSLLPIVGAYGADLAGVAFAGLGSAICKLPPVMMCNPNEPGSTAFDVDAYIGKGIRLVANDGGGYTPGNFGYLETAAGNGAIATARTLGMTEIPGECVATDSVTTKPGEQISVLDALNTRFGIFANGLNNVCGNDNAACPGSGNSRIDLAKKAGNNCAIGNGGFEVGPNPYRPTDLVDMDSAERALLDPMGYPRDKCHAISVTGNCTLNGRIGDGQWDRGAYFASNSHIWTGGAMPTNYNWGNWGYPELTAVTNTPTRYQVYRAEYRDSKMASAPTRMDNSLTVQGAPLCNPPAPIPPGSAPDRRVLSIAVINCEAEEVVGKTSGVEVEEWVDVFLVEPAARRGNGGSLVTEASDLYVEVIGRATLGGGATQGQEIRKDVPYLIE